MLIIFDLDDTLIDSSKCLGELKIRDSFQSMIDAGFTPSNKESALNDLLTSNKTAENATQAFQIFATKYSLTDEQINAAIATYSSGWDLSQINVTALAAANETLHALKVQGHTLALVSYGDPVVQEAKIRSAKIDRAVFTQIHITTQYNKQDYYQKVLSSLAIPASQTVVIGDKSKTDLLPAKALGCITVLMRHGRGAIRRDSDRFDYEIESLPQVLEILEIIESRN